MNMLKRPMVVPALLAALTLSAGLVPAADQTATQNKAQAQEQIYGSQLMTKQERAEYRAKMRAAKTAEEREQIRQEHHARMQDCAKARGVRLPDMPPAGQDGMGPGGKGMGPGGGMGGGR